MRNFFRMPNIILITKGNVFCPDRCGTAQQFKKTEGRAKIVVSLQYVYTALSLFAVQNTSGHSNSISTRKIQ